MDLDNIGKLVKSLREEKGWSQQELADQIPISRESISKWEKGRNIPDYQSLIRISEIFQITIDELMTGKKNVKKDNSILIKSFIQLYEEKNILKKRIFQISLLLVILTFCFLFYYFICSYNSIKFYNINYEDNKISINNGVFLTTNKKIYFRIGDIALKDSNEIKFLTLYFEDEVGFEQMIMGTTNTEIEIMEDYGYNEYFNCDDIDHILNNLYLRIEYFDSTSTIKLQLSEIFSNDNLLVRRIKSI